MSVIEIIRMPVGQQATNCYLVWEQNTKQGVIVDPGDDATSITEKISELGLQIEGIYLTHGHFDHLLGLLELLLATGAPFYMHPADAFLLTRAQSTAQHFGFESDPVPTDFVALCAVALPQTEWKVIETPGHTPGSVCLMLTSEVPIFLDGSELDEHQVLFTGDTLLPEEKTDTSHRYSSTKELRASFAKLRDIVGQTVVLPGHGLPLPLVAYEALLK